MDAEPISTFSDYVKTADLAGRAHTGWAFCPDCYGNLMNEQHETTSADGAVCKRCDGTGTLWRVDGP